MEPVYRRLSALTPLSYEEIRVLGGFEARARDHGPGATLMTEGRATTRPSVVVSGWACHQRIMPDGRRQIFGFVLPGDVMGAWSGGRGRALANTVAVTPLSMIELPELDHISPDSALRTNISRAVKLAARQNEVFLFDHIMRLGCLTALERMAHLLLELRQRMAVVGLGDDRRFPMPLTQESLADALGLSTVHVNRTLQQLRRERLIEIAGGEVLLLDADLLASLADGTAPHPFTS
jgi:CRP-like cAMP-binding protein